MVQRSEGQFESQGGAKTPAQPAGTATMPGGLRRQILRFGIVGAVGFVVNVGMVEWLARSIGPIWAQVLAFPVAASVTWWLNRRYTFGVSRQAWHREWLHYILANAFGWAVINGVYFLLVLHFTLMYRHPSLALAVGAVLGMALNFAASKWIVFK
ncbi:GtrA family protein [Thiomonas sp. X19]|uniref:GtrA family protein n=1 Tax=Thiomonas sp. X19 TaxID=1050370 RepID=UPI000B6758F0|nr:GtrA family protein [Thiomonas sp. X19]SCC93045.1 GtrA family protein [Thiomonas sp. X19]